MAGRRPTVMERRRRQARVIAVVVALALVALIALPLLAMAAEPTARASDRTAAAFLAVAADEQDGDGDPVQRSLDVPVRAPSSQDEG